MQGNSLLFEDHFIVVIERPRLSPLFFFLDKFSSLAEPWVSATYLTYEWHPLNVKVQDVTHTQEVLSLSDLPWNM